eukprot:405533_1
MGPATSKHNEIKSINIKKKPPTIKYNENVLMTALIHRIEREHGIRVPKQLKKLIFEFYFIPFASDLLQTSEKYQLLNWIQNNIDSKYKLLFKGSIDGFSVKTFHEKCDEQGTTLIIIQSELNHIFGGYTTQSWNGYGQFKEDKKAWIYLLRSSKSDKPQKWEIKKVREAIYANRSYGPMFGFNDFYISNECNANNCSSTNLGISYFAPNDNQILAGSEDFKVLDYEVWRLF